MSQKKPQAILVIARKTLQKPVCLKPEQEIIEKNDQIQIREQGKILVQGVLEEDETFSKGRKKISILQQADESLNQALLTALVQAYEKTPSRYPAYLLVDPDNLELIQAAVRLEFTPYLGESAQSTREENEALWQQITEALRAQA